MGWWLLKFPPKSYDVERRGRGPLLRVYRENLTTTRSNWPTHTQPANASHPPDPNFKPPTGLIPDCRGPRPKTLRIEVKVHKETSTLTPYNKTVPSLFY